MQIPEEMQEQVDANLTKINLILEEIRILMTVAKHLDTITQEINEWVFEKNDFGTWSDYWISKSENFADQYQAIRLESMEKINELNQLSGGVVDFYRSQSERTDDDILKAALLFLDKDTVII
jgi:hypothetical protein